MGRLQKFKRSCIVSAKRKSMRILRRYYFSTVMIQSGHMVAQNAQPIHLSWSFINAGEYPLGFSLSCAIARHFFGQASTHRPHPLHRSVLNVTFMILFLLFHDCRYDVKNRVSPADQNISFEASGEKPKFRKCFPPRFFLPYEARSAIRPHG